MLNVRNVLLVGTLIFAAPAFAVEDYTEKNFKLVSKDTGTSVQYRGYTSGNQFTMVQLSQKVGKWKVGYRNTKSKGKTENRYRITAPKVLKFAGVTLKPRAEWRDWESDQKDSYLRLVPVIQTGGDITDKLSWFLDVKPKFAFGKEGTENGRLENVQNDLGVDWQFNKNISAGIFYEYVANDKLGKKEDFFGTSVVVKF